MKKEQPDPRGVIPYGNTWGHIDLLELHYGNDWKNAIRETSHWQRLSAGENLTGNRGSVNWAICTEYRIQHANDATWETLERGFIEVEPNWEEGGA